MTATDTFANVNFEILLKMHGGNVERALEAWKQICSMGGYGDVPPTYRGGLDLQGLRIAWDETKQGQYKRQNPNYGKNAVEPEFLTVCPVGGDTVNRIEDLAAGDKPKNI